MSNSYLEIFSVLSFIIGSLFLGLAIYWKRLTRLFFYGSILLFIFLLILVSIYLYKNKFPESKFYIITQLLVAIGTCGVIVIAVFGEKLKMILLPMKFKLIVIEADGEIAIWTNERKEEIKEVYFHLQVQNQNPPSIIKNCRVVLKSIRILSSKNSTEINTKKFIAPYSFKWALTHRDTRDFQKYQNISHESNLDFIRANFNKKNITCNCRLS